MPSRTLNEGKYVKLYRQRSSLDSSFPAKDKPFNMRELSGSLNFTNFYEVQKSFYLIYLDFLKCKNNI